MGWVIFGGLTGWLHTPNHPEPLESILGTVTKIDNYYKNYHVSFLTFSLYLLFSQMLCPYFATCWTGGKAQLFFIQHLLFDICVYLFITYFLINVLLIKA